MARGALRMRYITEQFIERLRHQDGPPLPRSKKKGFFFSGKRRRESEPPWTRERANTYRGKRKGETVSSGKHVRFTRADGVNYLKRNGGAQNNHWDGKTTHQGRETWRPTEKGIKKKEKHLNWKSNGEKLKWHGQNTLRNVLTNYWTDRIKLEFCGFQANKRAKKDHVAKWIFDRFKNFTQFFEFRYKSNFQVQFINGKCGLFPFFCTPRKREIIIPIWHLFLYTENWYLFLFDKSSQLRLFHAEDSQVAITISRDRSQGAIVTAYLRPILPATKRERQKKRKREEADLKVLSRELKYIPRDITLGY